MNNLFSDLVLLIGTNPMPPFVVASYFLRNQDKYSALKTIWLLYSEFNEFQHSTKEDAEHISEVLQSHFPVKVHLHPIRDISNARSIQEDIEKLVFQIDSEHVHMNYSGGTKAMVIHAYRSLEQSLIQNTSFSYLDSRRFRLVEDSSGESPHQKDLRHHIALHFQDFITLHGFELYSPLTTALPQHFLKPLAFFQALIEQETLESFWGVKERTGWFYIRQILSPALSGVYDIDKPKYLKRFKKQLIKLLPKYYEQLSYFHPSETFDALLETFESPYTFFRPKGTLTLNSDEEFRALFNMFRFLDGGWLEMYIFRAMESVLQELPFYSSLAMGLELKKKNWRTFFEMDVAALVGYQLIGISCTTYDSKSACKNKGFEIVHRTRQIGGDEIREILKMILVSYVGEQEKERLQQELSIDTGTSRTNILVLGKNDLEYTRLKEQLRDFIDYQVN